MLEFEDVFALYETELERAHVIDRADSKPVRQSSRHVPVALKEEVGGTDGGEDYATEGNPAIPKYLGKPNKPLVPTACIQSHPLGIHWRVALVIALW